MILFLVLTNWGRNFEDSNNDGHFYRYSKWLIIQMYKITNIPDKPAIYYEDKGCQIYFSKQLLLYNRVFFSW